MSLITRILIAASLLVPFAAQAHVKWFVDTEGVLANESTHFTWTQPAVLVWVGLVVACVSIGAMLERYVPEPTKRYCSAVNKRRNAILWAFQILVGAALLLTAYSGNIIAPTFTAATPWEQGMVVLQAVIGVTLILNFHAAKAGSMLVVLFVAAALQYGWLNLLEHVEFVGIGLYIALARTNNEAIKQTYRQWALPVLRVTTGIALITLALQEKLLHPDLGLVFLTDGHDWNFMYGIVGIEWFTNNIFILSAGMSELLFGLLLVLGVLTRITTVALAFFFVSTMFLLGPSELVGHLAVFGVALILIVFGAGQQLRPLMAPGIKRDECLL